MIPNTNLSNSQLELSSPTKSMRGSFTNEIERKNTKITKAFQKTLIQVKNDILDDLLQVYGWRSKAELPIAKVMFYKVIDKNPNEPTTTIEVSYESFPLTLSDLNDISLPNTLYLLKEAMVGFQKLFSVFGSFLVSNKMVGINKNNRCKVWINQNFAVNQPIDVQMFKSLPEKTFMNQIHSLFHKKAQKNKKTETLFTELSKCQKFQEYVQCIGKFSQNLGVQMATSFNTKIEQKQERKNNVSKSPIRNPNQLTNNSNIGEKNKVMPKFLNKNSTNDQFRSTIGISNNSQLRQKSRSITKSGIRNRTPLTNNRSQVNLHSPYKPSTATNIKIQRKQGETDHGSRTDYSFQKKMRTSSPLFNKKSSQMGDSTSSFTFEENQGPGEGKSVLNYQKKTFELKEVVKSDLHTVNTNSSSMTVLSPRRLIQKKDSLFDVDRDMIESIVIGNEHDRPKNNLFSTSDLEHLGKMGKTVVESCMPEDF